MGKTFSANDARAMIKTHQDLLGNLKKAAGAGEYYESIINDATDKATSGQISDILKEVPIDELNRDRAGFRLKALKESGFETVGDVYQATTLELSHVNGVSEDGARNLKKAAERIANTAKKNAKIRISIDNKTAESTELVSAIYKYKKAEPFTEIANKLLVRYESDIETSISDLEPATNSFKYLFASSYVKERANNAYEHLKSLVQGDYAKDATATCSQVSAAAKYTDEQAWKDFSEDPIRYTNVIENVSPEVPGADETVYGLPEDLAQAVDAQELKLEGLNCTLRRYQEWGVKYILHQKRVLLGDEMGLGKTIQAIASMVSLRNEGHTHFLVVCPASVITNWCREIEKMSDLKPIKIHGNDRAQAIEKWHKGGGVGVTTYETTGHIELEAEDRFSMLVVDEAHYIKNPEAQRTVNVKKICLHAERILFMTGTALENKVNEMIELVNILSPTMGSTVSRMAFMATAPKFREQVAPLYYRRKREDVLKELPELIISREWCNLLPEEEKIYEKAVLSKNYVGARRVSWNAENLEESSKAKRMLEIIAQAEAEERKVIVFSFFLDTIKAVSELLGDRCLEPINGSLSPEKRQDIVDQFTKAKPGTVLCAQIQSGGTGLNIQAASVVILCEPQFKPSIENQAISRAYRMGQTRNVLVYRLLCDNTVDESVMSMIEEKQKIFDAFADKSVAAEESQELDDKTFGKIIEEEIKRINEKNK